MSKTVKTKVGYFQDKFAVNNAVGSFKVAMRTDLAVVKVGHAPDDVLHERMFEDDIKFDVIVSQDVLQTTFLAIFCEDAVIGSINAESDKANNVVML